MNNPSQRQVEAVYEHHVPLKFLLANSSLIKAQVGRGRP